MKKRILINILCIFIILSFSIGMTEAAESSSSYSGASSWAVPELDRAAGYGFITGRIKDNMSSNITREEFAEIAVRFYEVYTGLNAEPGNAKFSDTSNPEILKAANLGLTTGIGDGKFGPKALVTREQIATMLLRALKVIRPEGDFTVTGSDKFSDDNLIANWAQEGVYYCSGVGIIKGIKNENKSFRFDPKGNSSREVAVIVITRAYEWFIQDKNSQGNGTSNNPGETQQGDNTPHDTNTSDDWNGSIIIVGSEFKQDQYIVTEVEDTSFIYLPYERFRYVFKMPYAGSFSYPDAGIKDGVITLVWKNAQGEPMIEVIMQVGSSIAYFNGEPIDITEGPFEKENEVYVPVNLFIQLFGMKSEMFQGRMLFAYEDDFPQSVLIGDWSSSHTNLFVGYKDMVTGVVSLPSFDWFREFNEDGTYRLVVASSGGYEDAILLQNGKYKVIGNVIYYYDCYETLYKGTPLLKQYENKHMGDRLEFDFINNYNQEEDKIELNCWYYRLKGEN